MDTLRFTGGQSLPETSALKGNLRIIANTMVTNIIRQVQFQYSIDNGATWVPFEEGPQGKGHFFLPLDPNELGHTGRMVALYNADGYYLWAEAMGIDPYYGDEYFYSSWQPGAYTGNGNDDIVKYWRGNYGYLPTHPTGCGDYFEEDYPQFERGGWRLPSMQEMALMGAYYLHIGDVPTKNTYYWSSSEDTGGNSYRTNSYRIELVEGKEDVSTNYVYKANPQHAYNIRCVYGDPVVNVPTTP